MSYVCNEMSSCSKVEHGGYLIRWGKELARQHRIFWGIQMTGSALVRNHK